MKILLTYLLLLFGMVVFGQTQTYQFKYVNNKGFDVGLLTINKNAFRFDSYQSIMKTGSDHKVYQYTLLPDGTSVAFESKPARYAGSTLFTYNGDVVTGEIVVKKDTLYDNVDTVINGLKCKKVSINYTRGVVIDEKINKIYIADTLCTVAWVCPSLKLYTPFTFSSKRLTGIVLRFEKVKKTCPFDNFYITVDPQYKSNVKDYPFELPPRCVIVKSQTDYQAKSLSALMKKIKDAESEY